MNEDAKKTALRMIPYGIDVLTADDGRGNVAAATVNWVTQTAFNPPLVVVGVKTDSGAYQIVKNTKRFGLNMLGKDGKGVAFTFSNRPSSKTASSPASRSTKGQPACRSSTRHPRPSNAESPASSSRATTTLSSAKSSTRMLESRSPAAQTPRSSK